MKLNDTMSGLNVVDYLIDNPKAMIVINHGFAEHVGRYDWLATEFNKAGYSAIVYDVKEHGDSIGKIEHYEDFIADLRGVVVYAKSLDPNLPIFNFGHSMGGLITALFGMMFGDMVNGQILSGPAVGLLPAVKGIKKPFLNIAGSILPNMMISNVVEDDICSDIEVVNAYKADPKVLSKARAQFLKEFAIKAPEYLLNNIKAYECDVLILHGEKDIIVPPSVSEYFYNHIESSDKERIVYPHLYHEILNEKEKDHIFKDILMWLEKRI